MSYLQTSNDEITSLSDGISESFSPGAGFTANIHGIFDDLEVPELTAKINGIFENPEIPELSAKINGIFENPEIPELTAKIHGIFDNSEFSDFSTMVDGIVRTPELVNTFYNSGAGAGFYQNPQSNITVPNININFSGSPEHMTENDLRTLARRISGYINQQLGVIDRREIRAVGGAW